MRALFATVLFCTVAACERAPAPARVTVEDARVQLPLVRGRPGSAYFTLRAEAADRLIGISSPKVQRIEVHESRTSGGIVRMGPAKDLAFDDELAFAPGGKHAMLFSIDPSLLAGATVPLTFTFERAPAVTVEAPVQLPGSGVNH